MSDNERVGLAPDNDTTHHVVENGGESPFMGFPLGKPEEQQQAEKRTYIQLNF